VLHGTEIALIDRPISSGGKGQPMQTKKLGNGGPTVRSRAVIAGGS
jgi:hypothetical protein